MPSKPSKPTPTRRTPAERSERRYERENSPMMAALRLRAEKKLRAEQRELAAPNGHRAPAADSQRALHELQVHQIELELQNAELKETRDRMEDALEKYTDLYDFAPVGYFSLTEQGVILDANLTGTILLGVERARLLSRRLQDFVALGDRADFTAFLKKVFANPIKHVHEALLLKDRIAFSAEFQAVSAISPSPQKWCRVAVSDVTPLRQAQQAVLRHEAIFTTLFQQAPVGIFVVDEQLRLQKINPSALPVFEGVRPWKGRDFSEAIHIIWPAKVADEVMQIFRHTLKTGEPYRSPDFSATRQDIGVEQAYEWQIQRIVLPSGLHGVVGFFTDVTERQRAEATRRRVEVLAASNRKLEAEIVRRQAVETDLSKSERHLSVSLGEARQLQTRMRNLSHQLLRAQEEERKRISRELHDDIVQSLVGISVHLQCLTRAATVNPAALRRQIAGTRQVVEKSIHSMHRFARELRPTLLDDLGLIPALRSHLKEFSQRTKLRLRFTAWAGVERLGEPGRTVLYRIAQSALANIAQHAAATQVIVSLRKIDDTVCLKIRDNGKSFDVARVLAAKRHRLGLIGSRERVEMVGGTFTVESAPGRGTTVCARVPFNDHSPARGGGDENLSPPSAGPES
ncbi:MAG: PAS domain-containing protein [Opitutaceae bacterium]